MAGSMIHGGQPGFVHTLGGVSLCVSQLDINVNRNVVDTRTNCGNSQTPGEVSTEISDSGPLGFGAGSDEATKWAHITGTAVAAWTAKPKNTTTAADNPVYGANLLGKSFKISMKPTGEIQQSFAAVVTDSTGYPTRATT